MRAGVTRLRAGSLGSVLFGAAALWVVAGLGVGGWALATAPLEEVALEGHAEVSAAQVLGLGGLSAGLPMPRVDPFETARRIDAHPRILATDVRRRFPGHLSIRVSERQPDLRVRLPGGQVALVDPDDVVLHVLPTAKLPEDVQTALPLVNGVRADALPSEPLRSVAIRRARSALVALRELGFPTDGNVALDTAEAFRLRLTLPDGPRLILPYDRLETALRTYQALAEHFPQVLEGAHTLDLTPLDGPGADRVILRRR